MVLSLRGLELHGLPNFVHSLRSHAGILDLHFEAEPTPEGRLTVRVAYDSDWTGVRNIIGAIKELGCPEVSLADTANEAAARSRQDAELAVMKRRLILSLSLSIPVFLLAMVMLQIPAFHQLYDVDIFPGLYRSNLSGLSRAHLLMWVLATPVQFWIGRLFYVHAFTSLRSGSANMDVLVVLGKLSPLLTNKAPQLRISILSI